MGRKLKIGVNGRFFCQPFSGIGRYSLNIFPEMAGHFPELEFVVAIPEKLPEELDKNLRYLSNLRFEVVAENVWLKRIHAGLAKADWEKNLLSEYFLREGVDLIHLPYPSLYKRKAGVPILITVHDAIPWVDQQYFRRNRLSAIYNNLTRKACQQADFLLTVSAESAKEILSLPGFDEEKLDVVYNACEFEPEAGGRQVREDHFLFYMGGYDKRKNVGRLVRIFLEEIAPYSDLGLVLGGNPLLNNSLFEEIDLKNSPYAGRVVKTGFLGNSELKDLYKSAWAYWSLTTREGFNLPLLEALTLGCPALVSNLAVHREVAGGVPYYLELSASNREIGKAILALQKDASLYNDLCERSANFSQVSKHKFSWKKSAKEVANLYQKLT